MNAKISVFVTYVEAIRHLLLYNLHDCTFKMSAFYYNILKLLNLQIGKGTVM